MNKTLARIAALVPLALFAWAIFTLATAPPEPAGDWRLHMTQQQHDLLIAPIDHAYRVTAYILTWTIQFGYLAYVALKWAAQGSEPGRPS